MTGEGAGDRVESAALPTLLTGIFGNGVSNGFDPGPGKRLLRDANADALVGAVRWGSLAVMGRNYVRRERGEFVTTEAALKDPPL